MSLSCLFSTFSPCPIQGPNDLAPRVPGTEGFPVMHDFQYSTILGKSSFLPILCFIEHFFYINFSFFLPTLVWIGQERNISSFCFSLLPGVGRGRAGERHLTDNSAGRRTGRAEVSQLAQASSFQHKSLADFQWRLLSGSQANLTNQAKQSLSKYFFYIMLLLPVLLTWYHRVGHYIPQARPLKVHFFPSTNQWKCSFWNV